LSKLPPDASLMVISDHGHSLRPINVVNINDLLHEEGLLSYDSSNNGGKPKGLTPMLRRSTAKWVNNNRFVGKMASKFISMFPGSVSMYTSSLPIDCDKSTAYLSDPSGGLKAYSYAGIRIRQDGVSESDYEALREKIMAMVSKITGPTNGEPLVEWVRRREEVYDGPNITKYPDIVFKLRDDWGVGWDVGSGRYGTNLTHKLHSGNHRQDTAVCFLKLAPGLQRIRNDAELMDIAPTVLEILGVEGNDGFDGTSFVRNGQKMPL
jgi:predicted AlkP superfamily phosphohydrolase/phosphomutase